MEIMLNEKLIIDNQLSKKYKLMSNGEILFQK